MNEDAPKPKNDYPMPPPHISERAMYGWVQAAEIAHKMGVLTEADTVALEMLAEAIGDIRAARESLSQPLILGDVVMAEAGERYYWTTGTSSMRRARPEVGDIADADRRIAAWCSKFGMTPADRSRVSAAPGEAVNPFAALG